MDDWDKKWLLQKFLFVGSFFMMSRGTLYMLGDIYEKFLGISMIFASVAVLQTLIKFKSIKKM